MTQEDKELLLKDLCARLPYEIIVKVFDDAHGNFDSYVISIDTNKACIETEPTKELNYNPYIFYRLIDIKPYLRPMSSMTKEERGNYQTLCFEVSYNCETEKWLIKLFDWLNSHYFDYRCLIEKGLALEAPEDMYNIKE